jgi:hypothetical protein
MPRKYMVGDRVFVSGYGNNGRGGLVCFRDGEECRITGSSENMPLFQVSRLSHKGGKCEFAWAYSHCFSDFAPRGERRQSDRRSQIDARSGTFYGLISSLEDFSRARSYTENPLTEDQIEVLKDALSHVRKDGSANGYRKAERRKSW